MVIDNINYFLIEGVGTKRQITTSNTLHIEGINGGTGDTNYTVRSTQLFAGGGLSTRTLSGLNDEEYYQQSSEQNVDPNIEMVTALVCFLVYTHYFIIC